MHTASKGYRWQTIINEEDKRRKSRSRGRGWQEEWRRTRRRSRKRRFGN
jgi:hypothetical protein